ncbi:GAF domain-containing sensor histidine kinase [Macrococcoides goetzii]|uniref:GAF domain-containing sensor histidine kinase n=1 Tax=Macrococcus TaxID=69965 RepID=UPI001EF29DD9|nr:MULTISPECIES: GAF domain-containing sensor histidine kinase [Macrococcus]MCG7420756.1 GAF domain-containing sensor histidine kinase [Macrococcus epidermidis]MCH4984614.1 GAF domain-containing sensor histidine kinase [Macrococcus sp. PK]
MKNSTLLLKEIAEFLNEETEVYSMMNGALDRLVKGTNFSTGWIFFIDEDGTHALASEYGLPDALLMDDCRYMTEGPCWCVSRYHQKKLTKASNIITCSRIVKANKQYSDKTGGITHHATVPLQSGDERFGLLNVATPNTKIYSEEDLALLESVAFQIGSAIKRIYLTEKARETALQEERNRLARDLHDSVNQMLFSLKLTAHAAGTMSKDEQSIQAFQMIESTSQDAVNEMRALIWQLKPVGLEQGLVEAVKNYAEVLGLNVTIKVTGLLNLESKVEHTIFRIIQEAMNNVKKHAQTDAVSIHLSQKSEQFIMKIEDKGKGFKVTSAKTLPTHGLKNILQRSNEIGAEVNMKSEENVGTIIELFYPKGQQHENNNRR